MLSIIKKIIVKISDHIAFLRPLLLIPVWTPTLLGFWAGGGNSGIKGESQALLLATFLAAGIYGINQIYDAEGDKINGKNLPLALGFISPLMAWIITISSFVAALIVAVFFSLSVAILTIFGILLGISYSLPPIKFKDRGFYALTSNAVGHGAVMYLIGYLFAMKANPNLQWKWDVLLRTLPYAVAYASVYIFTTVPDEAGDKRVGKRTISVIYGARKGMVLGIIGVFLSGALGILCREPAIFLTAVISMPFYLFAVSQPKIEAKDILRANKVAVLSLAIFTIFYFPQFVLLVAAAIVFASIYNRTRLGVKYP